LQENFKLSTQQKIINEKKEDMPLILADRVFSVIVLHVNVTAKKELARNEFYVILVENHS